MPQTTKSGCSISYQVSSHLLPSCGKTASVQKGLLPVLAGSHSDLCEEGVGFGVPILQYKRDFFFSGASLVSEEGTMESRTAWKKYTMDLIDRRQGRQSKRISMFSWAPQRMYNRIYKSFNGRRVLRLIESRLEWLRPNYDPSTFFRVRNRGTVFVSFTVDFEADVIEVAMDFSRIERSGLQHIYVSNELGGNLFESYTDSSGITLQGDAIGAWDRITASWAALYAPRRNVGFRVEVPESVQAFRGREIIGADISWSGIIFMVPPSTKNLLYKITMLFNNSGDD
jgi:hypothetical protein